MRSSCRHELVAFLVRRLLHLRRDQALLELRVRFEHQRELSCGGRRGHPFLEDVSGFVVKPSSCVARGEQRAQPSGLVRQLAHGAAEHGLHLEPGDLVGVLGEKVAQLEQESTVVVTDVASAVEDRDNVIGCLLPPPSGDEELDELVGAGGFELEEPAVDADGGLGGAGREGGEAEVERPDAVVLRDGERAQRAVEGAACARDEALLEERGEVHLPYPRHAVQRGERALEGAVQGLVRRVLPAMRLGARGGGGALEEVGVPELVAAREGAHGALLEGRGGAGSEVAAPRADAVRVPQDVLLVRQVGLRRQGQRHRHRDDGGGHYLRCARAPAFPAVYGEVSNSLDP